MSRRRIHLIVLKLMLVIAMLSTSVPRQLPAAVALGARLGSSALEGAF
jgi:hypothetical protein